MLISNNLETSAWNCFPEKKSNNKYAVFFVVTDNYSFATANVIMGLKQYSSELLNSCDILIYHNGISDKHKQLLSTLHDNIIFSEFVLPFSWAIMESHRTPAQWGSIVLCKFLGIELVKIYEKVLLLDADMLIRGDISPLFDVEEDIAWRKVISWNPNQYFASLLRNPNDSISVCNAGLILFTNKINKYNIDNNSILQAYELTKDIERGGIDETLLAWLVYSNEMSVKELDVEIYNTPARDITPNTKIVHFLIYKSILTKPWKNLAAYLFFNDWVENYRRWLAIGGEDVIDFEQQDYYKLFAYDKEKEIADLKKQVKKLKNSRISKLEQELKQIKSSTSWKITKPLRQLAKIFRTLKKKVKSCFRK